MKNDNEQEIVKEIEYYNSLPCIFDDFIDIPDLSDGVISLVCTRKNQAHPEKQWIPVPNYDFAVCKGVEKIGDVNLRIGYTDFLYYSGQISYRIDEKHRGNGYAERACRLLVPVAKAHGMTKLLIAANPANTASIRVCEKLGTRFVRTARLPEWHDRYGTGGCYYRNIYEWNM